MVSILRVVSGGQTGVDRAALDAASRMGLPTGGWCPKGRLAEDGAIDMGYPLQETPTDVYTERTEWNVRDSDGTMIIHMGSVSGGTALTLLLAKNYGRPHRLVDLSEATDPVATARWIRDCGIGTLNVAGPRESGHPGVYTRAYRFLMAVLGVLVAEH